MTRTTRLLRKAAARETDLKAQDRFNSIALLACRQTRAIRSVLDKQRQDAVLSAGKRFGAELLCLDMAATTLAYWLLLAQQRREEKRTILWSYNGSSPDRPAIVFEALFTGAINSILGTRTLLTLGLGQPLRSVFRNQLELGLIMVAITTDEVFFHDYLAQVDAPEGNLTAWNKVRPKVALRKIDEALGRTELDGGARADFHRWRKSTYSWLSGFEHGHPAALVVSASAWEGSTKRRTSIGGCIDDSLENLAHMIVWSSYEVITLLTGSLFRVHGWRGQGTEFTDEVILSTRFFQSYALELMKEQDGRAARSSTEAGTA